MQTWKHMGPRHSTGGSAMLIALVAVMVVAGLSLAFLQIGLSSSRETDQNRDNANALLLAEAGIVEGLTALRSGGSGNVGSPALPATYGEGVLWVEATPLGGSATRLVSSGMCGKGRTSLEVVVDLSQSTLSMIGVLSNKELEIGPNAFADSYDSALGTYASQVAGGSAGQGIAIQSNEGIVTGTDAQIHGDVNPGPSSSVSLGPGSTVSGSMNPLPEKFVLEDVAVPSIPSSGALNVAGSKTLTSGLYHFSAVSLGNGSTLTIDGPATIVIDGELNAGQCTLNLGTNGQPVEIFVRGDVTTIPHTTINTAADNSSLVSFYLVGNAGQTATFDAKSQFHGSIYGPRASIEIGTHFELYGALAADQIALKNKGRLHYDQALSNINVGPPRLLSQAWTPAEFQAAEYRHDRRDPFQLLGIPRTQLPAPADSYQ